MDTQWPASYQLVGEVKAHQGYDELRPLSQMTSCVICLHFERASRWLVLSFFKSDKSVEFFVLF